MIFLHFCIFLQHKQDKGTWQLRFAINQIQSAYVRKSHKPFLWLNIIRNKFDACKPFVFHRMCLVSSILAWNGLPKLFFLRTVANLQKFPLIKLLPSNPSLIPHFEYAEVRDLEVSLKIHDLVVAFTFT